MASYDIFCLIFPRFYRIFGDLIGSAVLCHDSVRGLFFTRPLLSYSNLSWLLLVSSQVQLTSFRLYFYEVIPNASSQNDTRPFLCEVIPMRSLVAFLLFAFFVSLSFAHIISPSSSLSRNLLIRREGTFENLFELNPFGGLLVKTHSIPSSSSRIAPSSSPIVQVHGLWSYDLRLDILRFLLIISSSSYSFFTSKNQGKDDPSHQGFLLQRGLLFFG
ncbi:hypothetical protein Salat_2615400 [Sesamum alatum]|uniref:Uncharacterized protein n=1 Tax=Sesamum alatum TaxID=300844 RepID=A0AAE2CAJ5_9LAMI|nr:hypothetical protein Salat_2615400 [Sesamum alatum]